MAGLGAAGQGAAGHGKAGLGKGKTLQDRTGRLDVMPDSLAWTDKLEVPA